MWIESDFLVPRSSFEEPVTPPAPSPAAAPLACIQLNITWLAYLAGAAKQLCNPATWDTNDDALLTKTLEYATAVVFTILEATAGGMYSERFFECQLQYSIDGGTTWGAVPGWTENFSGCVIANQAYPVMTSGVVNPPVPVWTVDGTDWVYSTTP
jgi:hypothetical protein